jgi:ABC-type branched-subunit amino acid transport system substrate-binding protein/glycosylphosphatidylinositol transamidase (GPIT) subunit GPI8
MTLSGADDPGYRDIFEWVRGRVNEAGGVAGHELEYEYVDHMLIDVEDGANKLAEDDSVLAVVGPEFSSYTFRVAPTFLRAKKPMISPEATSDQISRAYAGKKYIWRTVEPDVAQIKIQLAIAAKLGARTVALLTSNDAYGETFFNWFGFFATELKLQAVRLVRDDLEMDTCEDATAEAVALDESGAPPDILVATPGLVEQSVCIVRAAQKVSPSTKIMFGDGGRFQGMIDELGSEAEGIQGTIPAPNPDSGFNADFEQTYGRPAPAFAASIYDAVLLAAYGLGRSNAQGGEALADAMIDVVDSRGVTAWWDSYGIQKGMEELAAGRLPNITGATGPLDFDRDFHVDPVKTYYAHWIVKDGAFVDLGFYETGDDSEGGSEDLDAAFRTVASEKEELGNEQSYDPGPRTGLQALIVAGSSGWENYRHQSDAMAKYHMLKSNGVQDDHIVLILADDLANAPENEEPGVIRNRVGGENLYEDIEIDYRLSQLNKQQVLDILAGRASAQLPTVVESGPTDNLFVFWDSHGGSDGLMYDVDDPTAESADTTLTPQDLSDTVDYMYTEGRYRRMFVVVEACHGGVMGEVLTAPGVLLMAGANPFENSLGANYDPEIDTWLGNKFAYEFQLAAETSLETTIAQLYGDLYLKVSGSHVTVRNADKFGNTSAIKLSEFLAP